MGHRSALAVCEAALRDNPSDVDLQFAYAVARDQWADHGEGTPADNFYAVTIYRGLAGSGHSLAKYALGTMYDEDAGVTAESGLATMADATRGAFGDAIACSATRELYVGKELGLAGIQLNLPDLERRARASPGCAAEVAQIYANSAPGELTLAVPIEAYIRSAAVNGTGWGAYHLGYAYANGADGAWSNLYAGKITVAQNLERGGLWLLVHYWYLMQNAKLAQREDELIGSHFSSRNNAMAIQTGLRALGFYSGAIDGSLGPASRAALASFLASDTVDIVFQRIRSEESLNPLLPSRVELHYGGAALNGG